jgi:hypothetical protein
MKGESKMEDKYGYIRDISTEELINIIEKKFDMDVTIEAMIELSDRDEKKTLELGMKLLKNNEGDTYFQAMIFDIIYNFDYCKVIECLIGRNNNIEAYLIGHIMEIMAIRGEKDLYSGYINFIIKQYCLLDANEKNKITEQYNNFVDEFKVSFK